MKIITFASDKGGTGKSTLATAAMTTLAKKGKKILCIDLDRSLAMTQIFKRVDYTPTSIDLLNGDKVEPIKTDVENIWIIPSDIRIYRMASLPTKLLQNKLAKMDLSMFDYVFIDPPGTLNALTSTAIIAADKLIIPSMPSEIDFHTTALIFEDLGDLGCEADINIVLNGNDPKKNIDGIFEMFQDEYDEYLYQFPISAMKSLKNLAARVNTYKLTGRAKEIIDGFVMEVVL